MGEPTVSPSRLMQYLVPLSAALSAVLTKAFCYFLYSEWVNVTISPDRLLPNPSLFNIYYIFLANLTLYDLFTSSSIVKQPTNV
jgi:hypothetical protein